MNQAHFHLVVNHLPMIAPLIATIVLFCGIIFRSEIVKRVAYFIYIIGAIMTLPTMLSGEGAEEMIENMKGISEHYIHEHEEAAEKFALLSYFLGGFALFGLWANWKTKSFTNLVAYVVLVFAFIVIYLGRKTGTSGGEIRHTEIRANQLPDLQKDQDRENESGEPEDVNE
jgi:uncharacterized membrane protein